MSSFSLMMLMLVAVLTSSVDLSAGMPPPQTTAEPPLGCTFENLTIAEGINPGQINVNVGDMNCNSCSCDMAGTAFCAPCPGADASGEPDTSGDGEPDADGDGSTDSPVDGEPNPSEDGAPDETGEGAANPPEEGTPNAPGEGAPGSPDEDASGDGAPEDGAPDAPEEPPATCVAPGGQVITAGGTTALTSNPNVTCQCEGNSPNATCIDPSCVDSNPKTPNQCRPWSQMGYCDKNKSWMSNNCQNSCQVCLYGKCEDKPACATNKYNKADCNKPASHPGIITDCPKLCNACVKKST